MTSCVRKPRVLIVADDLTGALNTAVAFARDCRVVHVARGPGAVPEALSRGPDVLAVTTGTRDADARVAAMCVCQLSELLDLPSIPLVI